MNKLAVILGFIGFAALVIFCGLTCGGQNAGAQTYYTIDKDHTAVPDASEMLKDGAAWNAGNVGYAVYSSALGKSAKITMSNVTSTGSYQARAKYGATMEVYGVFHDATIAATVDNVAIADAVWDEALSGHATAGSAGKKLTDLPASGTGDTIVLAPFQGSVSYAGPVATKSTVRRIAGNTTTMRVTIKSGGAAMDLTGWTVKWALKQKFTDTTYAISPKDITADVVAPATEGLVDIKFTNAETKDLSGLYYGEVTIYSGSEIQTGWQCNLYVDPAVIK